VLVVAPGFEGIVKVKFAASLIMKFNKNTFYNCLGSPEDRVFMFMLLLLLIKFKCVTIAIIHEVGQTLSDGSSVRQRQNVSSCLDVIVATKFIARKHNVDALIKIYGD
jgi:hypothetical protein